MRKEVCLRIMVSGAAGFLGSHLSFELLNQGHEVIGVDNYYSGSRTSIAHLKDYKTWEFINHDVTFPLYVEVDQIYNLAAPASPKKYQRNPVQTLKTIVSGSINQLGLAKRTSSRYLLASTSEVYGNPEVHPQSENYVGRVNPIGPRACYDEGKRAAETLTVDYRRSFGVDTRIVRIFNTYGPGMSIDDGRVMSSFVRSGIKGEPMKVFGDGNQTRSFCFVDDTINGLTALMAAEDNDGLPVNIGNPVEITVLELARKVNEVFGRPQNYIEFLPLPADDPARRCPDISRAWKTLGWSPAISLDEGLSMMIIDFESKMNQTN